MKKLVVIPILGILTFLNGAEISGQGFLKTNGGDVKTCAGNSVYLNLAGKDDYVISYALYKASSRVQKLLGNSDIENAPDVVEHRNNLTKIPKNKYYETICDAQGNFKFKNIKNGKYNIGTTVEWYVGKEIQGGFINKEINVSDSLNTVFITQ